MDALRSRQVGPLLVGRFDAEWFIWGVRPDVDRIDVSDDRGVAHVLEAPIIGLVVVTAIALALQAGTHDIGASEAQQAYEQRETHAQDVLATGHHWCCPEDPSSASVLQNKAMRAWAGKPTPLEETFLPWFPDPESTDFALKAVWVPRDGHATHTVDLHRTGPSDGKAAGTQYAARPAHQGPAYVVPRLDKFSAEANADILTVPVDNIWPYQTDPVGAHTDQIQTEVRYERTQDATEAQADLTTYAETTGTPRPAVTLHWQEPDWQELEAENDIIHLEEEGGLGRTFTQVLTKDDLAAERSLHQRVEEGPDTDLEEDESEPHPQHPFHLQVNISGPPAVDAGNLDPHPDIEALTLTDAYRLAVYVPRNWTDVEIRDGDSERNEGTWARTTIQDLPSGGHRITSVLDEPATFNVTHHPDGVLINTTQIRAPFRFHARPPSEQASTDLGFHELQATLESTRFPVRERSHLTVEVANTPGRVHRTLTTNTPSLVPSTPWADDEVETREGIEHTIGAVFKNGGEETEVHRFTWSLPHRSQTFPRITPLEDFTDAPYPWRLEETDTGHWQLVWQPRDDTIDTTCGELEACSVAARVTLDGSGLDPHGLWAAPRLETLYEPDDVRSYVDWFVRSQRAWEGVPLDDDPRPGFALAHRSTQVHAGPAEGSYRFTLPPTSSPTCDEGRIEQRDQADRQRRGDRVFYDFGPREDGLPHLDPTEATDCPARGRDFVVIGQNGDRWTTDAVGKHTYRSIPSLSGQTVADWQNGLAESHVHGPDTVRAGDRAPFAVEMRSLMTTLLLDDSVGDITVDRLVYDPYNAWEGEPWLAQTLVRPAGETDLHTYPPVGVSGQGGQNLWYCTLSCDSVEVEHRRPPSRIDQSLLVPETTVPGTHLLVVEVTWEFTTAEGNDITETGRLIEPFDVLTPEGDRAQEATLGMTAWDSDWR